MVARRLAVRLAYLGTEFDGYARQPGRRTVEGELLRALQDAGAISSAHAGRFASGSRTDKGVSALGNVAAFDTQRAPETVLAAANARLADVWLRGYRQVPHDFEPRHAKRRVYSYTLPGRSALDVERLRGAVHAFQGTHDFTAFARVEPHRDPVREVTRAKVRVTRDALRFHFEGPNFLWNQVRRMVGAALAAGRGDLEPRDIEAALRDPRRRVAAAPAPAVFLVLERVDYGFPFRAVPHARELAERALREAWRAAAWREQFLRRALPLFE